jgi:hypothetical protein
MRQADFVISITFEQISLKKTCTTPCVTVCHLYL